MDDSIVGQSLLSGEGRPHWTLLPDYAANVAKGFVSGHPFVLQGLVESHLALLRDVELLSALAPPSRRHLFRVLPQDLQCFLLVHCRLIVDDLVDLVVEHSVFPLHFVHLSLQLFKLSLSFAKGVLCREELGVQVCVLMVAQVDCVDVVFVLEPEIIEGTFQIFNVVRRLAADMVELHSQAVTFSICIGSPLRFFLETDLDLLKLSL